MMRPQFAFVRAFLGAILIVNIIAAPTLAAQAPQPLRPTVFVHGLGNNSSTWQETADRLAQDFAIAPHRPDLSSWSLFETQAQQLRSFANAVGLPASTVAIGYSNGGIVSRKANADGQPFDGVVTAATPHAGAELARSIVSGRVARFSQIVLFDLAQPFLYYAYYWERWGLVAYGFANAMYGLILGIDAQTQEIGFRAQGSVLPEMYPGSEFLAGASGLNSASNLSREAGALGRRVGITSETNPETGRIGIAWRGIVPDYWRPITLLQYQLIHVLLLAFEHYANYWDYDDPEAADKRAGAGLWLIAAGAIAIIDPMWCQFIGARSSERACEPSDGIVPVASQKYPGATRDRGMVGPAHLQVPNSSILQDRLASTLAEDFGVPRRVAGVSASPASLSLSPGMSASLTATAVDRHGNPELASIGWQSANSGIATVNQSGLVTGVAAGNTSITAWAYNFSHAVPVSVVNAPSLSGVTISGPTEVPSGVMSEWTATPVGGLPPFTYVWRLNNTQTQSGASASLSRRLFANAQISVTVTDARGHSRSATRSVIVSGGCADQRSC